VVSSLFRAWVADPSLLPAGQMSHVEEQGAPRVVADYIAGMTDQYILKLYDAWAAISGDPEV
jgi:dGTPase